MSLDACVLAGETWSLLCFFLLLPMAPHLLTMKNLEHSNLSLLLRLFLFLPLRFLFLLLACAGRAHKRSELAQVCLMRFGFVRLISFHLVPISFAFTHLPGFFSCPPCLQVSSSHSFSPLADASVQTSARICTNLHGNHAFECARFVTMRYAHWLSLFTWFPFIAT